LNLIGDIEESQQFSQMTESTQLSQGSLSVSSPTCSPTISTTSHHTPHQQHHLSQPFQLEEEDVIMVPFVGLTKQKSKLPVISITEESQDIKIPMATEESNLAALLSEWLIDSA